MFHEKKLVRLRFKSNGFHACHLLDSIPNYSVVNTMNQTIRERVAKALEELRPRLQADGGDVELLGVDNGIVQVRLKGACAGCPMATITIKMGVEQYLKKKIPEIVRVEAL